MGWISRLAVEDKEIAAILAERLHSWSTSSRCSKRPRILETLDLAVKLRREVDEGLDPNRAELARHCGISSADLARRLGINPAAVTRQVQELEGQSLVRRRADRMDGRRSYVSLSPKGSRLFEEAHDRSHEFERSLSAVAGVDDMQSAARVLAKLRTFVEGLTQGTQGGRR